MVGIAHKNSQRLTHLINDLLDMEKIAAGKLHFDMQVQPLMPIVHQALESHRTYGTERRVALALKGEATAAELRVDSQRLMQAAGQTCCRTRSSSRPRAARWRSSCARSAARSGWRWSITVPAFPRRSAAASSRSSRRRMRPIRARRAAPASAWRSPASWSSAWAGRSASIRLRARAPTFWVEFPRELAGQPAATEGVLDTSVAADAPRILVVEDEADIAQLLSLMLTRAGYRVDIALSGREALAALQDTAYAALSLDLMLPDISGLEIIRQVRQCPDTADLPIMVVSAKMEEGRLAINGDFSAIDWLAKPFDENRLLAVVQGLLSQAGAANPRVLHVEDDDDLYQVVRSMVGERFDFERATTSCARRSSACRASASTW